jgi:hypothetical protein
MPIKTSSRYTSVKLTCPQSVTKGRTAKSVGPSAMETARHTPTIRDAEDLTHLLVSAFPTIDCVLLCGSVARGDANEWSDIDLVVTSSDAKLTTAELRMALPKNGDHVSLMYYPTSAFQKVVQQRPSFVAHLKKEGMALYDRLGLLQSFLKQPLVSRADVAEEIRAYRAKLEAYNYPRRYNNNFLFCLSRLYSIGKAVIMLDLAKSGVFEFNRESAFRRFADLNPDLAEQVEKVSQLRPFYSLVNGREPGPLPFSYHSAATQMQEAVNAIESLAERAECL